MCLSLSSLLSLSSQMSLSPLSHLRCLSLFSLSLSMTMAMCDVCDVCVLRLGCVCCGALWSVRYEICVSCCFVCAVRCVYIQNVPVCTFKMLPCALSKRPCHIRHDRFNGAHGRRTGAALFISVSLYLCRFLCSSSSLSVLIYVSLSCRLWVSLLNDEDISAEMVQTAACVDQNVASRRTATSG